MEQGRTITEHEGVLRGLNLYKWLDAVEVNIASKFRVRTIGKEKIFVFT